MSITDFENKRWKMNDQEVSFKHKATFSMIGNGRVLDVGCGDGILLNLLKRNNKDGIGVDISEEAVKKCRLKGLDVKLQKKDDQLPFKDGDFEYVVLSDVLEHSYSPEDLIREAKRVSKKYLIISVPNFNSITSRIQCLFGNVPENNKPNKGHVFWFNHKILKDLLSKNKLKIVSLKTNTFLEDAFLIKYLAKALKLLFPSVFALSFVVMVEK